MRGQPGDGAIDYEFYRMQARTERSRVRCAIFRSVPPLIWPLFAVALMAGAIWVTPTGPRDCAICEPQIARSASIIQ